MRMTGITGAALAGSLAIVLAGCGGGGAEVTAENASVAEVAQKVRASDLGSEKFISAGRWEMTMQISDMDIPGIPPEMKQQMQAAMGQGRKFATCVTPEEAARPKEDFFAGENAPNCRYDNFAMGRGKIDLAMSCKEDGKITKMVMNGSYSDDAYTMAMDMNGQSEEGAMSMKATIKGARAGECRGDELG